jgi:AbrB family looped-hinge helix DNA binding protein
MKALGMIRRVDDLGRLVIPKEVRRTQGWDSGQPMEMFMTEEGLLIKPYSLDKEKRELVAQLAILREGTHNIDAKDIYTHAMDLIKGGDA